MEEVPEQPGTMNSPDHHGSTGTEHLEQDPEHHRSTSTEHLEQDPGHQGSTGTEHMEQDPEPPLPELRLDEDTEKDESLSRDVRYSLEVWVPADKEKLFENLNVSDRQLLTSNEGWLNGTLIDAAMQLLKYQYPSIAGLQSSALAIQLDFKRTDRFFIQIINRLPINQGTHWLVLSNPGCQSNEVKIFDSAFDDIPYLEEQVIASIVDTKASDLQMLMMDVQRQTNGNDCGLFSIANAITLCLGLNPCDFNYRIPLMRSHLMKCLENREMKMFPLTVQGSRKRKKKSCIKSTITTDLFCVCRMPDTHTMYVYCDECGIEFHPACIDLTDDEAKVMDSVYCLECKAHRR